MFCATSDGGPALPTDVEYSNLQSRVSRQQSFTGQADILKVLGDAGALQELLEKAATTEAADANVEATLNWLKKQYHERAGVAHTGGKPLRASRAALAAAREWRCQWPS